MAVEVAVSAYMNQVSVDFSHNPLHDIESLWWVGVWFILCHYPSEFGDITVQRHIKVVKKFGETLFNNRGNHLSRRHALVGTTLLTNIKPRSFPVAIQRLNRFAQRFLRATCYVLQKLQTTGISRSVVLQS